MTDTTYGAKFQKDGKTYAIQIRIPAGEVPSEALETLARVARPYHISLVKITSVQRFLLVRVKEEDIAAIRKKLRESWYRIDRPWCPVRPVLPG